MPCIDLGSYYRFCINPDYVTENSDYVTENSDDVRILFEPFSLQLNHFPVFEPFFTVFEPFSTVFEQFFSFYTCDKQVLWESAGTFFPRDNSHYTRQVAHFTRSWSSAFQPRDFVFEAVGMCLFFTSIPKQKVLSFYGTETFRF